MLMQIIDSVFGTLFIAGLTIAGFTLLFTVMIFLLTEPKIERPRALKALYTVAVPFLLATVISGLATFIIHYKDLVSH